MTRPAFASVPHELGRLGRATLRRLARPFAWHEYGGLLVSLRNVVDALARVTAWANRSGPSTRRRRRYEVPGRLLSFATAGAGASFVPGGEGYGEQDER